MQSIRAFTIRQKTTGKRYHGQAKVSFGVRYYLLDAESDTWHRTITAAYEAARETGRLWEVK